jgi:hypothetical protein
MQMNNEQSKKIYIAPTVEVIEIQCQAPLLEDSQHMEEMGRADCLKDFYA